MPSTVWDREIAEVYDKTSASMFEPETLGPTCVALVELAGGGPALEFAIGTGRVGLALRERGVEVHGIELSPHMAAQLRTKPGAASVPVTIGDMTTARAPGEFRLVYLVFNTILNVTTQDEQVQVFRNAARHLEPGGRFVIEVVVPQLSKFLAGEIGRVFHFDADHIGVDTLDDPVAQLATSHHWMEVDGRLIKRSGTWRWVWPSELDLMARIAGLQLEHRWADWRRSPFTADSPSQVAVYRRS